MSLEQCRADFEKWTREKPGHPEIKWIGHSYANAYMAAQWEGFKAAKEIYDK